MAPDRESAETLFQFRRASYELAELRIVVNNKTPDETADEIAALLLPTL
jgi:hypothetical protein